MDIPGSTLPRPAIKLPRRILRRPSWAKPGRPWRVSMRSFDRFVQKTLTRTWIAVKNAKGKIVRHRRPTRLEATRAAVCEVLRRCA